MLLHLYTANTTTSIYINFTSFLVKTHMDGTHDVLRAVASYLLSIAFTNWNVAIFYFSVKKTKLRFTVTVILVPLWHTSTPLLDIHDSPPFVYWYTPNQLYTPSCFGNL